MPPGGKPVWPVRNWTDSSSFLDNWRIKESAGREQSLPPFPIFLGRSKETLLVGYWSPCSDDTVLLRIRVLRMPQLLKSMTNSGRSRKLLHIIFNKDKNPLDALLSHQIRVKFSSDEWSIWKLLLHSLPLDISATVVRLSLTLSSVSVICMVAKDISFQNSLTFSW